MASRYLPTSAGATRTKSSCRSAHQSENRFTACRYAFRVNRLRIFPCRNSSNANRAAVAPYNLQVRKLRDRLPAGARVGSVDKFQGQEAPMVIISMCSSAGDFGTRGLQFLLNKNRLNVAVSRAKSLTIVVGDPGIAHTSVSSVKDMALVNMFCRLVEHGRSFRTGS